ncbi:MAG: glycerate kinase [Candidatus Eremiobacteraeota bacterium]|nr:glycerate kinase [Candidatus Eremiobacteraeota bacterium]MBC5827126.1 glycerate kinase [Candidatus Eremiobacteraeota bacterium]
MAEAAAQRIVIASDKFKGSLSSKEAGTAIAQGFGHVFPHASIEVVPIADGGEGTIEALLTAQGGTRMARTVSGPQGESVRSFFALLGGGDVAVVELAQASGLNLVSAGSNDPRTATTFGTGQLVAAAIDAGARRIVLAVGGSATNDAGAGALSALGARFCDAAGEELARGGGALGELTRIDLRALRARLRGVTIDVACDVTNVLCGPDGASAVYGPQKGATPRAVAALEGALDRFSRVAADTTGIDVRDLAGSGAAGGTAGGFVALAGANIVSGAALVLEAVRLPQRLRGANLVVTGEGVLDSQSLEGKAPFAVARAAMTAGVPAVALVGTIACDNSRLAAIGIRTAATIVPGPMSLKDALSDARLLLRDAAQRLASAIALDL